MRAFSTLRLVLASAALAAAFAVAVYIQRDEGAPDAALLATQPSACSSCDARHARLKDLRADPVEAKE